MGTFGTKGGGGKFGSKPSPADSIDDMVCHPVSVLAQPADPPADSPDLPYDKYEVTRDNRKYDPWLKSNGCAPMSYLLLNMDEHWDEIDALPWKGKPHKSAGTKFPWKTLPNIINNENLNEIADCMLKNYGIDIRKGLSIEWVGNKDNWIDEFFECKALLMRKKFGIEIPPPREFDLGSKFNMPIGCPPLCLGQSLVLNYTWVVQEYVLTKTYPFGDIGAFFGADAVGWGIGRGKQKVGGHALKAKVTCCPDSYKTDSGCPKNQLCFEGYDGPAQGGNKIKICIQPNGKITMNTISNRASQAKGVCVKTLKKELQDMKTLNLTEPRIKRCYENVVGVTLTSAKNSWVQKIVTEVDCIEGLQRVK